MERPAKRQRTSGASDTRTTTQLEVKQAQQETALEVDIFILDYCAQKTIQACLESRLPANGQLSSELLLEENILMSDDVLALFKERYSTYTADRELRFRILLLQFTTLFTQRLTENCTTPSPMSLESRRKKNAKRADTWRSASGLPSGSSDLKPYESSTPSCTPEILQRNRAHVLSELRIFNFNEQIPFYGTASCLSLLDLLPLFMQVSALVTTILDKHVTEQWMELASEFMLQATLEQYLVYGAYGTEAINSAFAWGPLPPTPVANTPQAGQKPLASSPPNPDEDINLCLATRTAEWAEIKGRCLTALFPIPQNSSGTENGPSSAQTTTTTGLASMLEEVARDFPIRDFDSSMLNFLENVAKVIPDPVLVQLERGNLDGMTAAETQTFLTDVCGLNDDEQNFGWKEFTGLPAMPGE